MTENLFLSPQVTNWLLDGPPWVEYRTRIDLLGQSESDPDVTAARLAMLADQQVKALVKGLHAWPGGTLKRHNDADHALHKLAFLADLGLRATDAPLEPVIARVLAHQAKEGAFQIMVNIPTHFGGSGEDDLQWMLCDFPTTLYALFKLGLGDDTRVELAANHLSGLIRENGWPCAAASALGKFRGPGRAVDPCPYANLVALKALAQTDARRASQACATATETLLNLWETRKEHKPYLFGMGTDFAKLKAPLIWYDLLHVLDVLSQFPSLHKDPRLQEMAALLESKADEQGLYTPQSVWMAWKGWEFGQKKLPSRWITLVALRVIKRIGS
jgi:hypothetical protein